MTNYPILDHINGPGDVKKLSLEEMSLLARDVRAKLVDTISSIGGHFAPNLGVVELTIALHYVFNSPHDKLVWDTGHQSYPHKLLTGRRDKLHTVKQYQGMSGFPRRAESPHDVFAVGHASTSLSVALGLAKARDARGGTEHVVAVIGDGALTGGIAYEALNNIGHYKTKLIVILNDNAFSIARNVGAMTKYLAELRARPRMRRAEKEIRQFMRGLPYVGSSLEKAAGTIEQGLTFLTAPDRMGVLFEEFGFNYVGPIDGHDLPQVIAHLEMAKESEGPILLQMITVKGKGYEPAEQDACTFHGVTPFDVATGKMQKGSGPPSYTGVFGNTLTELAKKDERVVAITAAMPDGTGLVKFSQEIPDRYYDVGIAEEHAVIFAAGLAVGGMRPVVAIYSTFLQRAFDPIIHDVCLQNLPVVFCLDRAGLVGEDGGGFHGNYDLSYLSCVPNMAVMAPKDENELRHMLKTAIAHEKGPVAIRYPRGSGLGVPMDEELKILPWGRSEVVREGKDGTILAVGRMVSYAVKAVQTLSAEGIDVGVVNARFIKPLDEALLLQLGKQYGSILTVEENVLRGGFGSAVLQFYNQSGLLPNLNFESMGIPDRFIEHGAPSLLLKECGLTSEDIVLRMKTLILRKKPVPMTVA